MTSKAINPSLATVVVDVSRAGTRVITATDRAWVLNTGLNPFAITSGGLFIFVEIFCSRAFIDDGPPLRAWLSDLLGRPDPFVEATRAFVFPQDDAHIFK